MGVEIKEFGVTKDGTVIHSFTLSNANGMQAVVMEYGATLQTLLVPDADNVLRDVVLGFRNFETYETKNNGYMGTIIGRCGNRIGRGEFTLGEQRVILQKNDKGNTLHSGFDGYNRRFWRGEVTGENEVTFFLHSPDGDQGFPGNLDVTVTYRLTEENALTLSYRGTTDADTVVNMTNHSYFNLEGQESMSVLEHQVWMDADAFTPTDADLIPTGEIRPVEGTPMDFRKFHKIGERINAEYEPLKLAGGYDHNYVLNRKRDTPSAKMYSEESGILMEVYTDLPGVQFYTGNFIEQEGNEKNYRGHVVRNAACFETQFFPDAVHHDNFPSVVVKKGETFKTETTYLFKRI